MAAIPILKSLLEGTSPNTVQVGSGEGALDGEAAPAIVPGQALVVFDDFVISDRGPVYTAIQWSDALGTYDQLTIHATFDDQSSDGLALVQIEHSADGRHWQNKNVDGEISTFWLNNTIPAAGTASLWGYDDAVNPSLALVRIRIEMEGVAQAHVKLVVVPREVK